MKTILSAWYSHHAPHGRGSSVGRVSAVTDKSHFSIVIRYTQFFIQKITVFDSVVCIFLQVDVLTMWLG